MACLIELEPLEWRSAQCAVPDVKGGKRSDAVDASHPHNLIEAVVRPRRCELFWAPSFTRVGACICWYPTSVSAFDSARRLLGILLRVQSDATAVLQAWGDTLMDRHIVVRHRKDVVRAEPRRLNSFATKSTAGTRQSLSDGEHIVKACRPERSRHARSSDDVVTNTYSRHPRRPSSRYDRWSKED